MGTASTTHIDRHHEKMAKSALAGMSEQIAAKYIPFLVEHDPERPVGVILAGKGLPVPLKSVPTDKIEADRRAVSGRILSPASPPAVGAANAAPRLPRHFPNPSRRFA